MDMRLPGSIYHLVKEVQCGRHYEVCYSECKAETLCSSMGMGQIAPVMSWLWSARLPRDPTGSTEDSPRKSASWLDLHPLLCSLLF